VHETSNSSIAFTFNIQLYAALETNNLSIYQETLKCLENLRKYNSNAMSVCLCARDAGARAGPTGRQSSRKILINISFPEKFSRTLIHQTEKGKIF
jgi:hypothetical protein